MMDLHTVKLMAWEWSNKIGRYITDTPPEAKVLTGDYKIDRQIYYFEVESGIVLHVSTEGGPTLIKGYDIVDEQKCAWFVLKWT